MKRALKSYLPGVLAALLLVSCNYSPSSVGDTSSQEMEPDNVYQREAVRDLEMLEVNKRGSKKGYDRNLFHWKKILIVMAVTPVMMF